MQAYTQKFYPVAGELVADKYRVDKMLGEGGMGAVLRAKNEITGQLVALKFMSPAVLSVSGALDRFVNEARAASMIDSKHIVRVIDVLKLDNGTRAIVMEYLVGEDLASILAKAGAAGIPVPIARAVHFVIQALRGLGAAHEKGIIHRDMKPANCFVVEEDGEEDFVKLVDFGISKVASEGGAALTKTNSALGTPLYMSPEQHRSAKGVDARTDIYACGAILYELLTGRTPHISESHEYAEIILKIFTTDPAPIRSLRPDVPDGLAHVIHRSIAREKEERPATAYELIELLAPYADERSANVLDQVRRAERKAGRASLASGIGSMAPPPRNALPSGAFGAAAPPPAQTGAVTAPPGDPTPRGSLPDALPHARTQAMAGWSRPPGPLEAPAGPSGPGVRGTPYPRPKPPLLALAAVGVIALGGGAGALYLLHRAPPMEVSFLVHVPSSASAIPDASESASSASAASVSSAVVAPSASVSPTASVTTRPVRTPTATTSKETRPPTGGPATAPAGVPTVGTLQTH